MIEGENRILQAFLGTLMTWALTAAGAALVFIFSSKKFQGKRKILDVALGFSSGVMTAASFWSLLAPGIKMAKKSGVYGEDGQFAFAPAGIGFMLGGLFVFLTDLCIHKLIDKEDAVAHIIMHGHTNHCHDNEVSVRSSGSNPEVTVTTATSNGTDISAVKISTDIEEKYQSWKRMILLVVAITVHNIPEGLAVGVGFGTIGEGCEDCTFASARNLAVAIGIQNFPEGMAVSVPLAAAGFTPLRSFWYGQFSGMVEPIFGVLGALIVSVATPLLPYALAFSAGAMIYVVMDDIIPEAQTGGNGRWCSWGCMFGFLVMMCLDVGLG